MESTYTGYGERIYLFPGHPPVTVEAGQDADIPYDPQDGCWSPTAEPTTSAPDDGPAPEEPEEG